MQFKQRSGLVTPVWPNWRRPVEAEFSYRTHIQTSFQGDEQREAMRQRARLRLDFETLLPAEHLQRFQSDLIADANRLFAVPLPWRRATVVEVFPDGVSVQPLVPWGKAGATVILDGDIREVATSIGTATVALSPSGEEATYIEFDAATAGTFNVGDRLYHAVLGRIDPSVSIRAETSSVWAGKVRFDADPGRDPQPVEEFDGATYAEYDGREIWDMRPNWRARAKIEFETKRRLVDYEVGRTYADSPHPDFLPMTYQWQYSGLKNAQCEAIIQFFHRMKGRRSMFRAPTWMDDLTVASDPVGSDIEFVGPYAYEQFTFGKTSVHLYYKGQPKFVTAAALDEVTGNSTLTLETPFADPPVASETMSWFQHFRLASDRLKMTWLTDQVMETSLSFRTLKDPRFSPAERSGYT